MSYSQSGRKPASRPASRRKRNLRACSQHMPRTAKLIRRFRTTLGAPIKLTEQSPGVLAGLGLARDVLAGLGDRAVDLGRLKRFRGIRVQSMYWLKGCRLVGIVPWPAPSQSAPGRRQTCCCNCRVPSARPLRRERPPVHASYLPVFHYARTDAPRVPLSG